MQSAILPAYMSIGIHGDHMGMTKFETKDDPGFISVAGELRRWVKELERAPRGGGGGNGGSGGRFCVDVVDAE